jgi:delta1-piperideine-2-carboxylate reductase
MSDTTTFTVEALRERILAILHKGGLSDVQAQAVAKVIVAGERDNCKSHGVYRAEAVLRTIKAGKVDPNSVPVIVEQEASAIIKVDAKFGFSNAAFELGLPLLVERAKSHGIAAMVVNDCNHFAALWPEIEALTAHGLAGLAMCPSISAVAPSGGNAALLGTNPFAFGWPRRGGNPYVFDFATSVAARGEVELHRRAGKPLPEGWAIDAEGNPTTDAAAGLAGALLPFGGHKGSAISTMIELLSAVMIGDRTSREALDYLEVASLAPQHGELIIAFSPEAFAGGRDGSVFDRAEVLFEAIAGQGARLPSQRRFAARVKSDAEGVTLTKLETDILDRLLEQGLDACTV